MTTRITTEIEDAARRAVASAIWAPSIHNTQPWSFRVHGEEILLRADVDRRLRVSDAAGRQMTISCGAALYNLRIALRSMGYRPLVSVLPDPDAPGLLARVRLGGRAETDEHSRMLAREIGRRRTHHGSFTAMPVSEELVNRLIHGTGAEGARLVPVRHPAAVRILASVTDAAQQTQAHNREFSLEVLRWAAPPGSPRRDGVPATAYPADAAEAGRTGFPQRDYAHGQGWGVPHRPGGPIPRSTGLVAALTTSGDSREQWLAAGQALQRVLLHAAAYGVSAAFHTQALELYHLREFLRQELFAGEPPQMIMRLGVALEEGRSVRRPVTDVS